MVITGLTRNQVGRKVSWVRIPPSPPREKPLPVWPVRAFLHKEGKGIRRGAEMNDVPVARQNRDRPRRVARRESNPTVSAKRKAFTGLAGKGFFTQRGKRGFEGGAEMNDVPVARQNRDRPRRAARRESNPTVSANLLGHVSGFEPAHGFFIFYTVYL